MMHPSEKGIGLVAFTHFYPWQIVTRMADLRLSCRLMNDVHVNIETIRSEVVKIIADYSPAIHSRHDHHDGGWKAIGLIAHQGNPFEDRLMFPLQRTPALSKAPYLESLVDCFKTEKRRVRLMELQPGKSILWHYDKVESIDDSDTVRLHIPIFTNPQVRFQISHEDMAWKSGEIWYGDFTFPHRLHNRGEESRIHLVIDLEVNDFVLGLFASDYLIERERRLHAKRICQRMVDRYSVGRLPPREIFHALARAAKKRAVYLTPHKLPKEK